MDNISFWLEELSAEISNLFDQFLAFTPNLLGAFLLLFVGVLVARLLKSLTIRLTIVINNVLDKVLRKGVFTKFRFSNKFSELFGKLIFWLTIFFFATGIAQILGVMSFTIWLNRIVAYLPTFIVGGLIVAAGFLLSAFARDIITSALISARIPHHRLIGGIVQGATLITAIVIGMDQIGIEVTFLVTLISILIGAIVGSFTLALAFGSKDLVSNLIGGYYIKQEYQPGQKIKLGNIEGIVLELTPVSLILSTEEGRMTIPAKEFQSQPSLLYLKDTKNE